MSYIRRHLEDRVISLSRSSLSLHTIWSLSPSAG